MTVEICETCAVAFCAECEEDSVTCAGGGHHCSECGWRNCRHCVAEARAEFRAEQAEDIRRFGY